MFEYCQLVSDVFCSMISNQMWTVPIPPYLAYFFYRKEYVPRGRRILIEEVRWYFVGLIFFWALLMLSYILLMIWAECICPWCFQVFAFPCFHAVNRISARIQASFLRPKIWIIYRFSISLHFPRDGFCVKHAQCLSQRFIVLFFFLWSIVFRMSTFFQFICIPLDDDKICLNFRYFFSDRLGDQYVARVCTKVSMVAIFPLLWGSKRVLLIFPLFYRPYYFTGWWTDFQLFWYRHAWSSNFIS